jgi:threonine dehydrogenase-like Zn-dependent dehydrogenase
MKVRLLATTGQGSFEELQWDKPAITDDEIEVRAVMTGVCRSDIDMMQGNFGPLPLHMQGHEGLGIVVEVGKNVTDVVPGDYVATRGEPAYADYYNVRQGEYVQVPEAHPKYIIEPVACGLNVVDQAIREIIERQGANKRLLINGSGFLAWVAYHRLKSLGLRFQIDVLGSSNLELWGDKLLLGTTDTYDVIIDLGGRLDYFDGASLNDNALIVLASQRKVTTDFGPLLWKACNIIFPSPRTPGFHQCMKDAVWMIQNKYLNIDKFWTTSYNRNTEWHKAFEDGVNRPEGYSRGYIKWD